MWELVLCSNQRVKVELGSILNKSTYSIYKFGKLVAQPQISPLQLLPNTCSSSVATQRGPGQAGVPGLGSAPRAHQAWAPPACPGGLLEPNLLWHMLPKELEAREQLSMEKLIASETLQPKGNQTVTPKPIKNQNNPPKSKPLYVCRCNKYCKAHLSFSPRVNKYKEITNAPKHQLPARKMLESAKYLQANWRESFCIVTQSQVASSSKQPNQTLFKFTSLT